MNAAVIICAAGASRRFGDKKKKIFQKVCNSPVFIRSINLFTQIDYVKQIILAISAEDQEKIEINWGANLAFDGVQISLGGDHRSQTVQKALEKIGDDIDIVAVHDAARCCTKLEWIKTAFEAAAKSGSAVLASPVVATIKKGENGEIISTVDRTNLYEAQTPQIFKKQLLLDAYSNMDSISDKETITDDCSLVEAMGKRVKIIETDASNIKITQKGDIAIAEAIIKSRESAAPKPFHPFKEDIW